MKLQSSNPCFRCGKERIITRTWTETLTTFSGLKQKVEFTDSVCPDPVCQGELNEELDKQKVKRDQITLARQQRTEEQKARNEMKRKVI